MNSADSLKIISERLLNENICSVPLDEKALSLIEQYMNARETGSDLMRRLSNIEINYIQIFSEAEQACENASIAKQEITSIFKKLIDDWKTSGALRDFAFSFTEDEINEMRNSFATAFEGIRFNSKTISHSLIVLGETSAQIRACSASFMEVYQETKLAIYAAMLNHEVDNILDCRAISLQAHASGNESGRASANFLGAARQCTKLIALINSTVSELIYTLKIGEEHTGRINITSPAKAANLVSEAIRTLETMSIQNK